MVRRAAEPAKAEKPPAPKVPEPKPAAAEVPKALVPVDDAEASKVRLLANRFLLFVSSLFLRASQDSCLAALRGLRPKMLHVSRHYYFLFMQSRKPSPLERGGTLQGEKAAGKVSSRC